MWGFSIPINLFTVLFAVMAPLVFLMILAQQPTLALVLGALVVAVGARRRTVRRRREAAEVAAVERRDRHLAELHAEALERRLRNRDR